MNATPTLTTVQVDWLTGCDLPDCLWIDGQCFRDALTGEELRDWLEDGPGRKGRHLGIVVRSLEKSLVLGYALYRLHDRSMHLERLAVSPHCRRQGIATCLVLSLTTKARALGRRRCVTSCCEERNLPVQCLLRALGFRCISSRPDPELPQERVYFFRYLALSPEVL